jgi:DegV family protein with EDD domain
MKVALVTDSNAQMPAVLLERYAVRVVPLTIVVDGEEYREGVDLDPSWFYERLAAGAEVSTAAPSPGSVLAAYEAVAAGGADAILSVHIGSNTSATLNSASIAARSSPVPVTLVDTGTASFAIGCCVWSAGSCLARGGTLDEARHAAESVATTIGNVFVVGALDRAAHGGRLASNAVAGIGAPVLALENGSMNPVARARDAADAVGAMVEYVTTASGGVAQRIGVGDACADELADELVAGLRAADNGHEIVRYEVGPSVGAHTGAGTVGAVFFPRG